MHRRSSALGYALIVVIGLILGLGVRIEAGQEYETARQHYVETSKARSKEAARLVQNSLLSIYENLRTLTFLPSVRQIDRHGTNLGADGQETIQQVYNNLAAHVPISEVYILPANFNPDRLDPFTGKPEEPILMFDQLIIHGGRYADEVDPFAAANADQVTGPAPDEIETYEYRQYTEQLGWLQKHFPDWKLINGLQVPMISGPEVITCDNTQYLLTRKDADRMGVLFSVPFYGQDNKLKGTVTAIILSNVLRKLLPEQNYALLNIEQSFISRPSAQGQELASNSWVREGKADPGLIYSEVIPLSIHDPRSNWAVWVGLPNSQFFTSAEFRSVRFAELLGYCVIALLTLAGLVCWALVQRNLALAHATSTILEGKVAERTAQIQHMATHDALTGLPNRVMLRERMEDALSRIRRGEQLAILCLDLDHFKSINDTLGHPVGDELLKAVTSRLKNCLNESEMVARFGGDEFVFIQTNVSQPDSATSMARKIIEAIAEPYDIQGHQIVAGASIGIAVAPTDGEQPETLFRNADIALYRAKSEGRGTCRFFEPGMDAQLQARRRLELELRQAVVRQQLALFYQPLVDIHTETVTGFEALLRWHHPERGIVLPSEFVPLAEEIGLINPIGEWVLRQACNDAASWPKNLKVAVNLSPVQFTKMTLPSSVVAALNHSGLLPSRLELEITESVLLANSETTMAMLYQLRSLGVRIALDDFGTGYSSLSYLRSFPFDKIKIDRSFVHETRDCSAIVKAVASLGASLGIMTTAEGVETAEQFARVKEQGCIEVQGYYFGQPRPLSQIEMLRRKEKITVA